MGGTTHVWDANGNLRDDGTFTYEYDYKNQLIEVKQKPLGMPVAWYRYDALGRRIEKQVMSGPTERYVLLGPRDDRGLRRIGTWKQDFVYGAGHRPDPDARAGRRARLRQRPGHDGARGSYYHRNALGSVMDITDPLTRRWP